MTKNTIVESQQRLNPWNILALCYLAAAILPFTLIPLRADSVGLTYDWAFRISFEDFARNILLFFPLGVIARYGFKWPHWIVFTSGLLFSLTIETAQLFIEVRTSNIADLVSNSSGAFLGSILSRWILPKWRSVEVPLAFMYVPLCWIGALRSLGDPSAAVIAPFNLLVGLILIQIASPRRFPFIPAIVWLQMATIPFFNTAPDVATGLLFVGLTALLITGYCPVAVLKRVAATAALLGFVLTLTKSGLWYFALHSDVVMYELLLRASEIVFGAIATTATICWSVKKN